MSERTRGTVIALELMYPFGSRVYIKHDPDQVARMVTSLQISMNGTVLYCCSAGPQNIWCHAAELTSTKEIINEHKQEEGE